jgi:hypothetical protein
VDTSGHSPCNPGTIQHQNSKHIIAAYLHLTHSCAPQLGLRRVLQHAEAERSKLLAAEAAILSNVYGVKSLSELKGKPQYSEAVDKVATAYSQGGRGCYSVCMRLDLG